MNKVIRLIVFSMLFATLGLGSSFVFAKGGGHGGDMPSGFSKGQKKGWEGKNTPPGWNHGKKQGWDGTDVPPGLSEKGSEDEKEESHKK